MIDWATIALFLAGAACLTLAISFGGTLYPFNSGTMAALWAVTGVLLVATICILLYHPAVKKEDRLYPVHFLKNPILVIMQAQVFLSSGILLVRCQSYYPDG